MVKPSRTIVLLGDLALHTMVERDTNPLDANTQPYRGYRRLASNPLLPRMIERALDGAAAVTPDYGLLCREVEHLAESCGELISILDVFPEASTKRRDVRNKLRVRQEYLVGPIDVTVSPYNALRGVMREIDERLTNNERLLVVYDHGGFLRKGLRSFDDGSNSMQRLAKLVGGATAGIIVGINGDLRDLKWLETIGKPVTTALRRRTLVQVTADSLRKEGLKIARYGPLEETVKDIFDNRSKPPLKQLFELADHLVVVFSETGGLYIEHSGDEWKGSLHFCPNLDRIAQSESKTYGFMPGKFAIFLVAIVKAFFHSGDDLDVAKAVRLGTVAYNRHFREGFGKQGPAFDPFRAFEEALSKEVVAGLVGAVGDPKERTLLVSSLAFTDKELNGEWTRTAALLKDELTLPGLLKKIIERGLDAVLVHKKEDFAHKNEYQSGQPWFPAPYISVPYSQIGKLKLLDHKEIANHYSLAKVMRKYLETKEWSTPLSIAVFGSPGSGKSFGVQQVLDAVDPGRKSKPLTFNLAQFSTVDQLTEAFHQIQDRALSSEEVPLAIFDEFDAQFQSTRLGWLKYFLAPMQDGLFRGQTGDYRVGRALFLFAGGTATSFADFRRPLCLLEKPPRTVSGAPDDPKLPAAGTGDEGWKIPDLRAVKLADFTSRLRGTLDISDVNEKEPGDNVSPMTQLRRAVILRTLLEKFAEPTLEASHEDNSKRARIHEKVIRAFLEQPKFSHGVRSMEAIIQMSRWIDDEFVPASLPSDELLAAHITHPFLGGGAADSGSAQRPLPPPLEPSANPEPAKI